MDHGIVLFNSPDETFILIAVIGICWMMLFSKLFRSPLDNIATFAFVIYGFDVYVWFVERPHPTPGVTIIVALVVVIMTFVWLEMRKHH